jgi:hypothetical protein
MVVEIKFALRIGAKTERRSGRIGVGRAGVMRRRTKGAIRAISKKINPSTSAAILIFSVVLIAQVVATKFHAWVNGGETGRVRCNGKKGGCGSGGSRSAKKGSVGTAPVFVSLLVGAIIIKRHPRGAWAKRQEDGRWALVIKI